MPGDPAPDPLEALLEEHIGRRVILISVAHAAPIEGLLNKAGEGLWKHSLQAGGGEPAKDLYIRTAGIMAMAINKLPGEQEGADGDSSVVSLS